MSVIRISQLIIYPVKSTSGIHLSQVYTEARGLAFDRRFIVTRPDGEAITARTHPKLLQVHSALMSDGLHLRAPAMPALDIRYDTFNNAYRPLEIWGHELKGQYCSVQADKWFSDYLGEQTQLLYCGDETERPVLHVEEFSRGNVVELSDKLSFADAYPLLVISEASLDDLNKRMIKPLEMNRFRPNLVVKGCDAFAEDSWKRVRIGDVEFDAVHASSRCILTTIDPETLIPDPDNQPLATLKRFRNGEHGVYFGYNLIPRNSGKISLYDKIEVLETIKPIVFEDRAPYLPVAKEITGNRIWQAGELAKLECLSIRTDSDNPSGNVKTFTFKHSKEYQANYYAGQFLSLELEIDGIPVYRNYTASSSPSRPDRISITVKRVDGGKVSNWLHDNVKTGDVLNARAPEGDFHCFAAPQDKILLLSAGSGITPMLSILRWMTDMQLDNDIVFFHCALTEDDIIAHEEVKLLAKQHGRCKIVYALSNTEAVKDDFFYGFFDKTMMESISDVNHRQCFVCGSAPFMVNAKKLLLDSGLPQSQYFEESFGEREFDPKKSTKPATILFDSWDTVVEGDTTLSILEQAEKVGVSIPYSCRSGFCGTCKVKLESGVVDQREDSGLTADEKSEGYILSCSCVPKGDLVITQGP